MAGEKERKGEDARNKYASVSMVPAIQVEESVELFPVKEGGAPLFPPFLYSISQDHNFVGWARPILLPISHTFPWHSNDFLES